MLDEGLERLLCLSLLPSYYPAGKRRPRPGSSRILLAEKRFESESRQPGTWNTNDQYYNSALAPRRPFTGFERMQWQAFHKLRFVCSWEMLQACLLLLPSYIRRSSSSADTSDQQD